MLLSRQRHWCMYFQALMQFLAFVCSQSLKFLFWLRQAFLLHPIVMFWKCYIFGKLVLSTFQNFYHFFQILPHPLSIIVLAFSVHSGYLGYFRSKDHFQGMGSFVLGYTIFCISLFLFLIIVVIICKHLYTNILR